MKPAFDIENELAILDARVVRAGGFLLFGYSRQCDVLLVRVGSESLGGDRQPGERTREVHATLHVAAAEFMASTSEIHIQYLKCINGNPADEEHYPTVTHQNHNF